MTNHLAPITLAFTGASGMPYGLRLLECLLQAKQPVYLMVSPAAQVVLSLETELDVSAHPAKQQALFTERFQAEPGLLTVFGTNQWSAPPASGSAAPRAMVICPCSSGCIGAIAHGISDTLLERAADVMLKERRPLILVHRETPLSVIHLENLLKLAQAGATILPANPGFYHRPTQLNELIDFVVARILDHLQIPHTLLPRWGMV